MRKLVLQTKLPKRRIEDVIKRRVSIPFTVTVKRGQLYVFFAQHIDEAVVASIARSLCMEIVSISKARATLRH